MDKVSVQLNSFTDITGARVLKGFSVRCDVGKIRKNQYIYIKKYAFRLKITPVRKAGVSR